MMGISEDSFYPNDPMTRAIFTQVMWNMAGQPAHALPGNSMPSPLENITGDQVRSIYNDYDLKSWSALGGPDKELIFQGTPIHPEIEKNFIQLTMPGMLYQTLYF